MYKMFLDDERFPVTDDFTIVRSCGSAIKLMNEKGCPEYVSFDHDLGVIEETGFSLAVYMVEKDMDMEGKFIPENFQFYVHSQNPIGAEKIRHYLNSYLDYRKRNNET